MFVTKQIQNKLERKKVNRHQRSILKEMMNTCDKLGNSFLTREQQKKFQQKEKQEKQLTRKTSVIEKQLFLQRFSHDPFRLSKDSSTTEDFVYVKQSKEIKQIKDLKEKMLPKVNKTNIQKKLKELSYIRNMGYRSKNKKLEQFQAFSREKDEENILNKSWEEFYQDKLFNSATQTPQEQEEIVRNFERKRSKKPTYFRKDQTDYADETSNFVNSLSQSFNTFLEPPRTRFRKLSSKFGKISQIDFTRTNHTSNASSGLFQMIQTHSRNSHHETGNHNEGQGTQGPVISLYKQRKSRASTRNKTIFKDVIKNLPRKVKPQSENPHYVQQLISTDRKKDNIQKMGLTKEKLQKQNAFKLYSLIKGGYELDRNDVQGEFISLKMFKEAKENFKILNNSFNKVRQYRYIVQEPQKVFNDGSFKSLVYLSEIENKIAPSVFRKVQQLNKVVD